MRIQLRRRMIGPTLKYLEELERLAPKDPELPGIYLELLRYNQGRRDTVTTLYWLERLATGFPRASETSDGYWQVIWDAIERGALAEATPLLEAAIAGSAGFHPVDQARLHYWRGRLRMRQGDQAGGDALWAELAERWPYNYYTALADWMRRGQQPRMLGPGADLTPDPEPPPRIKALWDVTPFPTALFLYAVGEPELAYELLQDAVAKPLPPAALEEAGALFHHLERHYLAMRLMANHHMERLRSSRVDGSPLWRRAFPRPHWDVVQQQANAQQVDPYFVFAIMREESRFYPFADSSAGAKGLMQLMPATARGMAKRHGLAYEEELLHTPELNIPLGTLYLKRVLERFDGNVVYAAAAYNAGPTNVQRWVKRHGNLPLDEFVERIPFGETQRYVKRVFLSYMVYTQLYR
jgi:soluble lytic murein transglycosylase